MKPSLVVLAAGGTGGHMFPAEALARELLGRGQGVALVTDARGQAFSLPEVATYRIRAGRFGGGIGAKLMGAIDLGLGTLEATRLLKRLRPTSAIGFGGYPSVPTMLAAARLGLPTAIHEQNAVLGRANRLLAARVSHIAVSFDTVTSIRAADRPKVVRTGNPVRPAVAALRDKPYAGPGMTGPIRLLITGGSQGAHVLSEIVPAALAALPDALRRRLDIVQQARAEDLAGVEAAYRATGIRAEAKTFFDDMPARLDAAHLLICRAGASTVTELCVAGRPAILIPYLHAMDDHQTANAQAIAASGGAWVLPQGQFSAERLTDLLEHILIDPAALTTAAARIRALGEPSAAARLADLVVALASSQGRAA
jgi:UDP-N-acetylglucosamine--N-acetylmuramyl-(pentapeptide) pyrophosphoryl-undecaprenol N-acetylglucosamine transferase